MTNLVAEPYPLGCCSRFLPFPSLLFLPYCVCPTHCRYGRPLFFIDLCDPFVLHELSLYGLQPRAIRCLRGGLKSFEERSPASALTKLVARLPPRAVQIVVAGPRKTLSIPAHLYYAYGHVDVLLKLGYAAESAHFDGRGGSSLWDLSRGRQRLLHRPEKDSLYSPSCTALISASTCCWNLAT